jgi:hypothetical protein
MSKKPGRSVRKRRDTKDRVLQARIPEQLDEELRDRAEELGLSVSTIVRNVLSHTFDLVEGVVTDSSHIARALTGHPPASSTNRDALPQAHTAAPDDATTVVGWQEAVLNRNGVCEECNVILPMGERAAIGVPAGARIVMLCLDCLGALTTTGDEPVKPPALPPKRKKKAATRVSAASKKTTD